VRQKPLRPVFKHISLIFILVLGLMAAQIAVAAPVQQAQLAIPVLVVNTSFLNVRSGDGPQYTVIATVVGGTELPVLASNENQSWYLVTTPVGNGWVDITFTLPRGDFRFLPSIQAGEPVVQTGSLPLSIGLVSALSTTASVPQTRTGAVRQVARLNVLSVNLRTQPNDSAEPLTILFNNTQPVYEVVGRTFDGRFVEWAALVVANFGTGWVEAAKLSFSTETIQTTTNTDAVSASSSSGLPIAVLNAPHIVVNTSFQNIRTGPGGQYTVITTASGGDTFNPLGITPDFLWYLVSGEFGFGWISSEFVLFRGDFRNVPILRDLY